MKDAQMRTAVGKGDKTRRCLGPVFEVPHHSAGFHKKGSLLQMSSRFYFAQRAFRSTCRSLGWVRVHTFNTMKRIKTRMGRCYLNAGVESLKKAIALPFQNTFLRLQSTIQYNVNH